MIATKFYRAYFNLNYLEPVSVRRALKETEPAHADMLRYDLGFHDPEEPSYVAFPIFRHPQGGRTSKDLTIERWRSFSIALQAQLSGTPDIDNWITYIEIPGTIGRRRQTFAEYFKAHPKLKVVGWR